MDGLAGRNGGVLLEEWGLFWLGFLVPLRFAQRRAKGWGTQSLFGVCLPVLRSETRGARILRLGGQLRQQCRIDGPAVELGEAQVAVKTHARQQGFLNGGIELSRHAALLHNQLPAGRGRLLGLLQHTVLARLLVLVIVHFKNHRTRAAQGKNLVEDAVGQLALGHLGQLDGG